MDVVRVRAYEVEPMRGLPQARLHSRLALRVSRHGAQATKREALYATRTKMTGLKSHEKMTIMGMQMAAARVPPAMILTGFKTIGPSLGAE